MTTKITNAQDLSTLINENSIKQPELTQFDFTKNQINFSGKQLEGVDFSDNKTPKNVLFQKSILIDCKFERAYLDACDFTEASPAIEILSMFQTGMGMLLTGFLGFVVANKVRKS